MSVDKGFAWYLGGNNTTHGNDWAPVVADVLAAGYQGMSVWVPVPGSSNGTADGSAAAAVTRARGCLLAALDIEAGLVAGSRPYCAAWNASARAGGCLTVGYSTPRGVAADEFDFDYGWAATPGDCDVAACPMPAGRRAVQCGSGQFAGVQYDVSFSDYDFGGIEVGPIIVLTTGNLAYFISGSVCVLLVPGEPAYAAFVSQGMKQFTDVDDQFIAHFQSAAAALQMKATGTLNVTGTVNLS